MSEIVNTYLLDNPNVLIPMDRAEFYREQVEIFRTLGRPTRAVEVINIFIFNEHGELYVQKRSDHKGHNAGLLDKSIGGHVQHGDPVDYTVMVESVQELQVPSIVLRSDLDFRKAFQLLGQYLGTVALIKPIDALIYEFNKVIGDDSIIIANKMNLFFGIYGGAVKTVDRESRGALLYSLEGLEAEMDKFAGLFTPELKVLVETYREQMYAFRDFILAQTK